MKKIFKIFVITVVAILIILFFWYCFLNLVWKKDFNRFDYDKSKKELMEFFKTNKKELEIIAEELYEKKTSKNNPYENIRYATYKNDSEFSFLKKSEYIQFDIDAQGMLGGQYYGLIYIKDDIYNSDDLFIYDENKETSKGNNIFIREKIANHWYYYYDDYDGKVNIKEIKK